MKKLKFIAVIAAFMSVIGFSSCMSDTESQYDLMDYMTVSEDLMGRVCLVGDYTGLTFYPANSSIMSALQMNDGSYYKRAYAGVKLAEEYSGTKKNYTISNLYVASAIPYMDFNLRQDTLKGDYGFNALNKIWAKTGYVNVDFNVNVESGNIASFYDDIHMYVTKVSNDTLYTKLRYEKSADFGQNYTIFVRKKSRDILPKNRLKAVKFYKQTAKQCGHKNSLVNNKFSYYTIDYCNLT